jgi:phosphoserine phosphatase
VSAPRFASVVIDVDSTLCGIEGVDWLAQLRGAAVAAQSTRLTERAMNGEIPIDAIYGERLALIRPTRAEVEALSRVYRETVAPGADAAIGALRAAGVRVALVSGGFHQAIGPLALELRVELHAVRLSWDDAGRYVGFDTASPLATQLGKLELVRALALPRPTLAVGDGSTDAGMRPAVDQFAAFTGFARREAVVAVADREFKTFAEMASAVMDAGESEDFPL